MRSPSFSKQTTIFVLIILALVQFACSLGAQTSSNNPQIPVSGSSSTQSPAATQPASATKSERGTPAEAQAMLQLAIQHYQTVGRTQALADFTAGASPFKDRDLYVACIDSHLVQSANGGFPNLVGSTIEPISRAAWDAASTDKIGSVSYQWINPITGKTEPKTFYYKKVGTDVCGVGAYNP